MVLAISFVLFLELGSLKLSKNGTRYSKIIEPPQALTASLGRKVVWRKERVDLAELAKLRWVDKMTVEGLMSHFGKSKTGIKKALRLLKKRGV